MHLVADGDPATASATPRRSSAERELLVFLAAAFGLSWGVGGAALLADLAYVGLGIGALCPGIAALLVTRRYEGSMRPLLSQITRRGIAPRWYLVALGLPAALVAAAMLLATAAGDTRVPEEAPPLWSAVLLLPIFLFFAGGPEEPGWRGFALPRLQERFDALTASVVVGAIWAVWHAPLWVMPVDLPQKGINFGLFALVLVELSIVFTWLFNSTRGSVLLAMALHAAFNISQLWIANDVLAWLVLAGATGAAAAVVIIVYGRATLSRGEQVTRDAMRLPAAAEHVAPAPAPA